MKHLPKLKKRDNNFKDFNIFKLKQISKLESMKPAYKAGKNTFKYLNYKPKFKNLNQMLKSNIKWFKKIY